MFNLEKEISNWKKSVRKYSSMEDGYCEELDSHLRETIDELIQEGFAEHEAFEEAKKRIGNTDNISTDYYIVSPHSKKLPPWKRKSILPVYLSSVIKQIARNFSRNFSFSIINLFGLTISMVICILLAQYVYFEKSFDSFHEKPENIYRLKNYRYYTSGLDSSAGTPALLGPEILEEIPEVEDFARCRKINAVVTYNDFVDREKNVFFADSSFFTIFNFPLVIGNKRTALSEPFSCVITESTAKKYFGNKNPDGQKLKFWTKDYFVVKGVVKDPPQNSHLKFDILLSFYSQYNPNFCSSCNNNNTFIRLKPGTDYRVVEAKLPALLKKYESDVFKFYKKEYKLQPITDIHLNSNLRFEPDENGNANEINLLTITAIAVLLIAYLNYINLATARSLKRGKEIGLRKTVGASKTQLFLQFIAESIFINVFSFLLSVIITIVLFTSFTNLIEKKLTLTLFHDAQFWFWAVIVLILGAFLAGFYPALIQSSYKPAEIFKNKTTGRSRNSLLRRILVISQFSLSVIMIAATLTVYNQVDFMINKNLGIDLKQTLAIVWPSIYSNEFNYDSALNSFQNDLKSSSKIENIAWASVVPGLENGDVGGGIKPETASDEEGKQIYQTWISPDFIDFFHIKLICGRQFTTNNLTRNHRRTTDNLPIILNKKAVETFGYKKPEDALGERIICEEGTMGIVIGVIDDFHQLSLDKPINPTIYFGSGWGDMFLIKLQTKDLQGSLSFIKEKFQNYYPGNPFNYFFVDENFNSQYKREILFGKVFGIFSILAIFISAIGLFGLASFNITQRIKEIGIRKVIGASTTNIIMLLSKEFMLTVLVSFSIGIATAFYIMNNWLQNYLYRIEIGTWFYLFPFFILGFVTTITTLYHIIKTSTTSLTEIMKYE